MDRSATPGAALPTAGAPYPAPITLAPLSADAAAGSGAGPTAAPRWERITIRRRESLYVALRRTGLRHEDIMAAVRVSKPHADLRRVQQGDVFEVVRAADGALRGLRFELDAEHYLLATTVEGKLQAQVLSYPVERVTKGVRGVIQSNLFDALKAESADPGLAVALSEILAWDIDFFRDIRKGDRFVLLYEEFVRDGRKVRDGQILAANFTNRGRTHEAYAYENALGFLAYYDGEGRSLEKQFLRAPLRFSHISSGFTRRRLHPVLKRYRPHYGIDYVAPRGTPIHATADGIIRLLRRSRGNGKHIVLRHGGTYETWYLHLSRFAKGQRVGSKVRQGDVIGYVGSTGLATAPHLDYRVKKNGRWVDPRKLDLPPAAPIEEERRAAFEARRDELRSLLAGIPSKSGTTVMLHRVGPLVARPSAAEIAAEASVR